MNILIAKYLKKNINETLIIFLLFTIGILVRFLFYGGQIWLGSDVTRDISIAREALLRRELPLTGSFSSAGPFVFGPTLYWLYMLGFLILPFSFLVPWFLGFTAAVGSIILLYSLAKKLGGSTFVFLVFFIAVFSPQLILSSFSPTQHTFVYIFSLLGIFSLYKLYKKGSLLTAFISGFFIGLAINMHYQAVNLIILPFIVLLFPTATLFKRIAYLLTVFIGTVASLVPLTYWDLGQQLANWRNLFDYLLIGQGRVYVANSWKLYVLDYLPKYFSYVTAIPSLASLILLSLGSSFVVFDFMKRKLNFILLLNIIFLALLFMGRYYRGERFAGYTVYLIPLIILFFGWTIDKILSFGNVSKQVLRQGVLLVFAISIITTSFFQLKSNTGANTSLAEVKEVADKLVNYYPGQKFRVSNLAGTNPDASFALATYLEYKNLYDINSPITIGFCVGCQKSLDSLGDLLGISYFVLNTEKNAGLWQPVSQAGIYDSTIGWLNQRQLKSTFHFDKYLKGKLIKHN